jgi:anti-sigma B factor antagonist
VDISGRIVLGEESAALRVLVCELLGEGHRKILLNLADVDYVDSTGLGHLVSAIASVRKMKGDLKLLKLTNKVHDVLQITKLHTIIDITDDEAVAIESFGRAITQQQQHDHRSGFNDGCRLRIWLPKRRPRATKSKRTAGKKVAPTTAWTIITREVASPRFSAAGVMQT